MHESTNPIDLALQEFESAWQSGAVSDFATAIPNEARSNTDLLTDLACIDLQNRIQRDIDTRVEAYTTAFPQLATDDLILLELIRTEYSYHPDRDSLDATTYCQRFPQISHEIERMFQLEFNRSGVIHSRQTGGQWKCSACDTIVTGRDAGETNCNQCGQPIAIGRYELIERVGQGAFGYVYRARDPKLDRQVAVKIPRSSRFLMPEESERFLRESRNAAQLDHPGIVRIFDTGRHEGIPYIVGEFVDGKPLSGLMAKREFGFREAASVMVEIATAVSHAHDRGVIHRDLKPSNIMAGTNPQTLRPRVMDFGLARRDQSDVTVTIEGQAIGTPAYMSPEQARGDLVMVNERSDIYSLGVILYQLLSGEVPFRGNVQNLIHQVIHDDPPPPSRYRSRIPADLETICMKAINRESSSRYGSVEEFGNDLTRWIEGKPIQARPIGHAEKLWRWCRRRPTVAMLLGTLAVTVFAGIAGITWQWREAEIARLASESDLGVALDSVDNVLGHLGSDTLADIPQAKQLRADVLNDALVFFQRFRKRNPDDPRVAMQVASAHYQVARIQHALGKIEEAEKAFKAATQGYEKIKGRAPDRKKWQEALASAYSGYANFLQRQSKRDEAHEQQKKCLALRKQLHNENPDSGRYAAKYASARADLGRTLKKAEEIEAEYDTAIEQLEKLVRERDAIGYSRDLARVLNNFSIHLTNRGKHGRAEKCRERAIQLFEKVIKDDPKDEGKRAIYANCCLQLVTRLRKESRVDAAKEYQDKAIAAYRSLTEDFPATPRHRDRFATVLHEVGSLAGTQHRTQDETKAYEEAVRQRETLVALFPGKIEYQRALANELKALAQSLVSADRPVDAEKRWREKLAINRSLSTDKSEREKIHIGTTLLELADVLSMSEMESKIEEAKTLRLEAKEIASSIGIDQILTADQSNSKKISLLTSLVFLGKKVGNSESVTNAYRAKIKLYQEGVALDPKRLSRKSGLAKQWYFLGEFLLSLDRQDEAIDAYKNAVKVDEELLAADAESATYTTQLISHSSKLGHLLYFSGQPSEGATVIRRSLELAKKLYEERKYEGFRHNRVVLAYTQLGDALAAEGKDYAGSLAAYNEAISMSAILKKQPWLEKFEATILNSTAWFLVTCPELSLRDPQRALKLSRKAISISPDNGSHVSTLALALYETGDFEESIETFRKSTELSEELSPLNTIIICLCQAKSGMIDKAKKTYAEAIRLNTAFATEPELFEIYRQQAEKMIPSEKAPTEPKLDKQ